MFVGLLFSGGGNMLVLKCLMTWRKLQHFLFIQNYSLFAFSPKFSLVSETVWNWNKKSSYGFPLYEHICHDIYFLWHNL